MRDRKKVKVCLRCNKLYEKCYCAYPFKKELGLFEIDKLLSPNGKVKVF